MTVEKLLAPDVSLRMDEPEDCLSRQFGNHVPILRTAYEQAGLSPVREHKRCIGLAGLNAVFQIELKVTPEDKVLGIHYVANSPDEIHVNEVDVFAWESFVEATSGRFRSPDSKYLVDYRLTLGGLQTVTALVAANINRFEIVETKQLLSIPQ